MDKVTREGAKMIEEAKRAAQWLRRHRLDELGNAGTSSMISDVELNNIECLSRTILDLTEQVQVRDRAMKELREELRSCKGAIRNYVAREGGLL
jgi:hypothetical protein